MFSYYSQMNFCAFIFLHLELYPLRLAVSTYCHDPCVPSVLSCLSVCVNFWTRCRHFFPFASSSQCVHKHWKLQNKLQDNLTVRPPDSLPEHDPNNILTKLFRVAPGIKPEHHPNNNRKQQSTMHRFNLEDRQHSNRPDHSHERIYGPLHLTRHTPANPFCLHPKDPILLSMPN